LKTSKYSGNYIYIPPALKSKNGLKGLQASNHFPEALAVVFVIETQCSLYAKETEVN
jgi:hypothetical protein